MAQFENVLVRISYTNLFALICVICGKKYEI